jgi:hypothetical protein
MFVRQLETLEDSGFPRVLDRLEAGGINSIVVGDLWFRDGCPGFAPDLTHYRGLDRRPPEVPSGAEGRVEAVARSFRVAVERGFRIYLHDWGHGGAGRGMNDPQSTGYAAARTRDVLARFPEVAGLITDGPEWGYEIEPGNRQDLFRPFSDLDEARAREWGFDPAALDAGATQFRARLGSIASGALSGAGEGGFFDAADLLMTDAEFYQWLSFRERTVREWVGALHQAVKSSSPEVAVACGPRTAAFAPLAGYNLRLLRNHTDFLCPKLYFWMHGFDGLKGTAHRWAATLMEWNPGLTERSALDCVYALFGFRIPGVRSFADLEQPLDREFFETVVPAEISRAVCRAGDAGCLQLWMGLHHGGVRISTEELGWLLDAVSGSALPGIIYWHYEDMQPEEWELLCSHVQRSHVRRN